MSAYVIEYSQDENYIAEGRPSGLIEISTVDCNDGSPLEKVCSINKHYQKIIYLYFLGGSRLLSVDIKGAVLITDYHSKETLNYLSLDKDDVSASISPSEKTLFLFSSVQTEEVFSIDLHTFEIIQGPSLTNVTSRSTCFAIDDKIAAYQGFKYDSANQKFIECLVYVNFITHEVTVKPFIGGPYRTTKQPIFGNPLFLINSEYNRGIRYAYNHPRSYYQQDDEVLLCDNGNAYVEIRLELFEVSTLKTIDTFFVAAMAFGKMSVKEEQEEIFKYIRTCKFAKKCTELWVGYSYGRVKRFNLNDFSKSVSIDHGGAPAAYKNSINDIGNRKITNNLTLGVSPNGTYIAFANPNEFFNSTILNNKKDDIKLPMRARTFAGGIAERARLIKLIGHGDFIVVCTEEGSIFLINRNTKEITHKFQVKWGYELNDALISDNHKHLILAYSSRNPLKVKLFEDGSIKIKSLPFRAVYCKQLSKSVYLFSDPKGAIVKMNKKKLSAFRVGKNNKVIKKRKDDLKYVTEERDKDEFGTQWIFQNHEAISPLYFDGGHDGDRNLSNKYFGENNYTVSSAHFELNNTNYTATLLEDGRLNVYEVGISRIFYIYGSSTVNGTHISASKDKLVIYADDASLENYVDKELEIFTLSQNSITKEHSIIDKKITFAKISPDAKILYIVRKSLGTLSALNLESYTEEIILTFEDARIDQVSMDDTTNRMLLTLENKENVVLDIQAGKIDFSFIIKVSEEKRSLEFTDYTTQITR